MAYDSRVYRVLIASPSDVEAERELAVHVIQAWNDLYSYPRQVVLLPLRWETHTAPEYGSRPQEVINRAIVDECDLLLGIFWTRIGTQTGEADSGTIEEISRVAQAGKPVMLYFSKVPIDPDKVDDQQFARLRSFKEQVSPNALTESYKSVGEFQDKLARQLELKIRDLQMADNAGQRTPLDLQFLAIESRELSGSSVEVSISLHEAPDSDIKATLISQDAEKFEQIKQVIAEEQQRAATIPVVLAVTNTGVSGIRNIYVEMSIRAIEGRIEVTDSFPNSRQMNYIISNFDQFTDAEDTYLLQKLEQLDKEKFRQTDKGWSFSFEWSAIQPQRIRIVQPKMFIVAKSPAQVEFAATVFADSLPQPALLRARMNIAMQKKIVPLSSFVSINQEQIMFQRGPRPKVTIRTKKIKART